MREMVEEQHPIILLNGMSLIVELRNMAWDDHGGDLEACIEHVLTDREAAITNRRSEEILLQSHSRANSLLWTVNPR